MTDGPTERPTQRSTDHASFTIERSFAHPPTRVFAAFSTQAHKVRWFVGPGDDWSSSDHEFDFRIGGREQLRSVAPDGTVILFSAHYLDIVPDQRIVYAYDMLVGDGRISVSLASIEFRASPVGTHLVLVEHGIYLDGLDNNGDRERGTHALLDQLAAWLDADPGNDAPTA